MSSTDLRGLQFYPAETVQSQEIVSFLDEIKSGFLLGGDVYLPAFYGWNIWRVFLAMNEVRNSIPEARDFNIDEHG